MSDAGRSVTRESRHCVLDDHSLSYYSSPEARLPKVCAAGVFAVSFVRTCSVISLSHACRQLQGRISLANSITYVHLGEPRWPHAIALHTPTTHHLFAAPDADTAATWLLALRLNGAFYGACSPETHELLVDSETGLRGALENARRKLVAPLATALSNAPADTTDRAVDAGHFGDGASGFDGSSYGVANSTWQYLDDFDTLQGPYSEFLMGVWLQVSSALWGVAWCDKRLGWGM